MYEEEADAEDPDYFESMRETLIDWHYDDPVNNIESMRNSLKAIYQEGKINPYIEDCTLVVRAFGDGSRVCNTVSNNNYANMERAYVYPNPVDGFVSIRGLDQSGDSIVIHDIHGRFIPSFPNLKFKWLDVSGYMAEVYVLTLYRKGKKIDSMKFLKR